MATPLEHPGHTEPWLSSHFLFIRYHQVSKMLCFILFPLIFRLGFVKFQIQDRRQLRCLFNISEWTWPHGSASIHQSLPVTGILPLPRTLQSWNWAALPQRYSLYNPDYLGYLPLYVSLFSWLLKLPGMSEHGS